MKMNEVWEWVRFLVVIVGGFVLAVILTISAAHDVGWGQTLLVEAALVWLFCFVSAITS